MYEKDTCMYKRQPNVCARPYRLHMVKYFQPVSRSNLPNPRGQLSLSIPSNAIQAANREVTRVQQSGVSTNSSTPSSKRGPYHKYTDKERAEIGKHAYEHGVGSATRKFSRKMGRALCHSTVQGMKAAYKREETRKRARQEDDDEPADLVIRELSQQKKGRPVLLRERMDGFIQKYITKVQEQGGMVNTAIVIACAKGILKQLDRTMLAEYGGHVTLSVPWAKSLLHRMQFTKRRGTTKCGLSTEAFQEVKRRFLQQVIEVVQMEDIPMELIFNWDQTGLHLIPQSNWTMERKGSKRVEVKGLQDKCQITAVLCGTMHGD